MSIKFWQQGSCEVSDVSRYLDEKAQLGWEFWMFIGSQYEDRDGDTKIRVLFRDKREEE